MINDHHKFLEMSIRYVISITYTGIGFLSDFQQDDVNQNKITVTLRSDDAC